MKAIQDHYPPEFAHCYGCGPANPQGLHLKSYLTGGRTHACFTPAVMYSGGYPGNVYGASAAAFAYRAQSRTMGDGGPPLRFVTASLKVDYKRPTPLGQELFIEGARRSLEGRKAIID